MLPLPASPPRLGHTPSSSIGSSKHSPEPQMQPTTSPQKPMGPRPPNQPPSLRITDNRSPRRPPGTSTDVQPASAPPTSRQSSRRNPRPAIVPPQDIPPGQYHNSHSSSPLPASAPPTFSTSGKLPPTPRSRPATTERGTTPTGRLPASSPQASHHHRAKSDGIPGGLGSHIDPRGAHTQGSTGMSSGRPRSPRDVGIVGGGATPAHLGHHMGNASGQSSGSDYSESGQYAIIDHPSSQPQQQASSGPVAQASRDQTSFDADGRPAASFNMSSVPRSQRLQVDYFQQQTMQQPTSTDLKRAESTRGAHGEPVKAKKNSWQEALDPRGSIAHLYNMAVEDAEKQHQLENSNGPLSSGSSGVLSSISEPSSYPGSVPSLAHLPSSGFYGRPGSRSGRENHGQPHVPQAPAIVPHDRSQNHHVTVSIPPVFTSQAGALPSPPRHIDIMPSYPPPPRPPRAVTDGSGSAVPSIANPSASAHGPTTSIPLKRPVSPHKPHTPPSPARPPPMPLARPPSPWKSPPPPPLSVSPAKSVPPPPPPIPAPRDQSLIKTPVLHPLSPASNSTNTSRLSVFARSSASPVNPTAPLPPVTSKSAPVPVPALPSPPTPPASLPDPITKPRPLSPQPQSLVKPLQLRTKNSSNSNNSPLPPPPMQLPPLPPPPTGKENNRENTNATRENANKVVPPPRSGARLVLPRADSEYSIVAVSVKSGSTEGAADDEEDKHDKVKVEVEVQVKGLKAVDKREERVESSESEYSGSESPCVSVPRVHDSQIKASTDKRFLSSPNSASKVTSSTVAVVPTPSAPKLQLEDKTKDASTGSLHLREPAEVVFLQMHRLVNVAVEQAEVTTPKKATRMLEELDATPTRGNIASNRGNVEPPVPVPVPAPVFSKRKEEVAHSAVALASSQPPPKSQLLNEPRVELRPISLGLINPEDIMFHFSEAEHIRLASDLTTEAPQRATYDHKPTRPPPRVTSPKRSTTVKKPPLHPGGHARRRDAIPSSGSECEGNTHEHRSRTNEEKRTPAPSPDFGDPFATQSSSSSRPATATTITTSSASATGHASLLEWAPPRRKRSTRPGKRNTIVGRPVPGSTNLYGVGSDDDDADDDDDEEDDEFEVKTEHGRVLEKLVKEKGSWPSAMSFHDVLSEPTIAGRAQGYATKLNELSREDCGLGDWIEVWLKPSEWRPVMGHEELLIFIHLQSSSLVNWIFNLLACPLITGSHLVLRSSPILPSLCESMRSELSILVQAQEAVHSNLETVLRHCRIPPLR